ncbi:MAG: exodeoxyribonuclease VII large subunit, partial [Myxococcota bacterium]
SGGQFQPACRRLCSMSDPRQPGFDLFARPREPRVLTVSELTGKVKSLLERSFSRVWVAGEISGASRQASGHCYFTLKDEGASLSAVLFRGQARRVKIELQDGMEVLAAGRLSLYAPRGRYQLVVDHVEPRGLGALQAAFEKLKAGLHAEGLFDAASKKSLPMLPRAIGVVTSPTGAAVHDLLRVLHRRNPKVCVLIAPAKVQGEGAAEELSRQLARLDARDDLDLLVVTRGGGSLEDLWPFNEEVLARAIHACRKPVVSAVGHEVDVTISDLVADLRAPTPSAAAEMIVPEHRELVRGLRALRDRMQGAMERRVEQRRASLETAWSRAADPRRMITDRRLDLEGLRARLETSNAAGVRARQRRLSELKALLEALHPRARLGRLSRSLNELQGRLARAAESGLRRERRVLQSRLERLRSHHPRSRIELERREVAELGMRLSGAVEKDLGKARESMAGLAGRLDALSPLRVLERGYSVVRSESGMLVRGPEDAPVGDLLSIRTAKARLRAKVVEAKGLNEQDDAPPTGRR